MRDKTSHACWVASCSPFYVCFVPFVLARDDNLRNNQKKQSWESEVYGARLSFTQTQVRASATDPADILAINIERWDVLDFCFFSSAQLSLAAVAVLLDESQESDGKIMNESRAMQASRISFT